MGAAGSHRSRDCSAGEIGRSTTRLGHPIPIPAIPGLIVGASVLEWRARSLARSELSRHAVWGTAAFLLGGAAGLALVGLVVYGGRIGQYELRPAAGVCRATPAEHGVTLILEVVAVGAGQVPRRIEGMAVTLNKFTGAGSQVTGLAPAPQGPGIPTSADDAL